MTRCYNMAQGDSSALQQWLVDKVASMQLSECGSVKCWLENLRQLTETECMCVLQGKSLTSETSDFVFSSTRTVKDSIDTIKGRAHVISSEFTKLFRKLEKGRWKHVRNGTLRLTCQIRSLLHECNSSLTSSSVDLTQHEQLLMEECGKLARYVDSTDSLNRGSSDAVPGPGTVAVPGLGTEAVPGPGTEAVPGLGTEAVPGPGTEAVPGLGTEAVPGPGREAVPGLGTEVVAGSFPGSVPGPAAEVVRLMTSVGKVFSSLVDLVLSLLLKKLLSLVLDPYHSHGVKASLSNLVSLGLEGEHMCVLIATEGGIETLFAVCRSTTFQFAHAQALRAIATVCCVAESIDKLDQVGGVYILTDILGNPRVSETIRAEAAGVIAQITSPCMEHYQHLSGFIDNLEVLVSSLTVLCAEASCHEVLLLASAALANITFMDNMACDFLQQCHTAQVLIEVCALDKADTMFAKDQVATVLGNMAAVETCVPDIMDNNGVEILIHFLYESCEAWAGAAERAACERVVQKSAIALTRLARLPDNARLVVEVGGIPRLIQLCREPKARNGSDAVLVACLAALRKICSVCPVEGEMCGVEDSRHLRELIQPKLIDTFFMCSSLDESAV